MKSTLATKRRTVQRATQVLAVALVLASAFSLMWLAVHPLPLHLLDQCDNRRNPKPSATIVAVGVISGDTLIRSPVPRHSNPTIPLQLRRLTVHVENVLKGASIPATIDVYYFTWAGGFDGPRPLGFWSVGDRRIFWLRTDHGVLRTVCDGWDGCTEAVWSGAHPNYRPNPQKPLEYTLVDFHLTRGTGPVNKIAFATEVSVQEPVGTPGLEEYAIGKLKHLALTEQDEIKSSACGSLWIYTVDLVKPNINRDAKNAMHVANCRCNKKADGNVEYQ